MKKRLVLLLALSLALPSRLRAEAYVCGPTGFNSNIASTTKSFRCALAQMTVGSGTITFNNATTNVTGTTGAFDGIVPPQSVPGADGNAFRASGLMAFTNGETFFLNVTGKTSGTLITAELGGASIGVSTTATRWGYWNTTCYRTAAAVNAYTDANISLTPAYWGAPTAFDRLTLSGQVAYPAMWFAYPQNAATASAVQITGRPRGMNTTSITPQLGTLFNGLTSSATAKLALYATLQPTVITKGREWDVELQSAAANSYITSCVWIP